MGVDPQGSWLLLSGEGFCVTFASASIDSWQIHAGRKQAITWWYSVTSRVLNAFSLSLKTRSSPQWWSGRSTTAHIVLDLRSLIWSFGESCTIVRCITSTPANVFSNLLYWHFRRYSSDWLKFERGTFRPLGLAGYWGRGGSSIGPLQARLSGGSY